MNVVSTKKNSKTARNSINIHSLCQLKWDCFRARHGLDLTQPTSKSLCSWKLVKISPLHGNAFLIKLPTPQEESQGKCQEYGLGGGGGGSIWQWSIFKMMSVEYNYQKSFCIKYLLKFKYPTEVCQTIALIWTWKQFSEESWPQLFKRCGWHYPRDNWQLFLESEWVLRPHGLLTQRPERREE